MSKESHLERTSKEPRDPLLHRVILRTIHEINPQIRLFRLEIPDHGTIKFLPGQWLDVYVPSVPKAGGFTITSPPSAARPHSPSSSLGYLELAVQKSPDNPPAAFLWQPTRSILGTALSVRVGGSFVWPPPGINPALPLRRVVLVAGGVGINPLVSMLAALAEEEDDDDDAGRELRVLYSLRDPGPGRRVAEEMLFVEQIATIFARERVTGRFELFLTGGDRGRGEEDDGDVVQCNEVNVPFRRRRISIADVVEAIGPDKDAAVVYVCGVPTMTDTFVEQLTSGDVKMDPARVLCEKWW